MNPRKIVAVLAICMSCLLLCPAFAYADGNDGDSPDALAAGEFSNLESQEIWTGDLEGPAVDLTSMGISAAQVTLGDAVELSVRASDPSGVAFVQAVLEHVGSGKKVYVTLVDDGSGTWKGSMAVEDTTPSGEWRCAWLTITDGAGNFTDFFDPSVGSQPVADLSAWGFTVSGAAADLEGPSVDLASMGISTTQVTLGGFVLLSVRMNDPSGVASAQAVLEHVDSGKKVYVTLGDDGTGTWRGLMKVEDATPSGEWRCAWLTATDGAGNFTDFYDPSVGSLPVADLSAWDFTIVPLVRSLITYKDGCQGSVFADSTILVENGKTTPAFDGNLLREGYLFDGWTPVVSEIVDGDAVYTATWKEDTRPVYTVIYTDGCGGTVFADIVYQVREGDRAPLSGDTSIRPGYLLDGWDAAPAKKVLSDLTYTAKWVPNADFVVAIDEGPIDISVSNPAVSSVVGLVEWRSSNNDLGSIGSATMSIGADGFAARCVFNPQKEGFATLSVVSAYDGTCYGSCTVLVTPSDGSGNGVDISSFVYTLPQDTVTYDPNGCFPTMTIKKGETELVAGQDYWVEYANNTAVGNATVIAHGMGSYRGTLSANFAITPVNISQVVSLQGLAPVQYSGSAIEPTPELTSKQGVALQRGVDFNVAYENNVNAGTATVTISGMGNYAGKITSTFTITTVQLSEDMVTIGKDACATDATKPPLVVECGGSRLVEGADFAVAYAPDAETGAVLATVTGMGNYSNVVSLRFTKEAIHRYGQWSVTKEATYGEAGKRSRTCSACRDVQVENIPALERTPISGAVITGLAPKAYTGTAIKPNPTVKVSGKTLKKGVDYTVSYKGNVNVGTAVVTVTGKGAYSGSKQAAFEVVKAANPMTAKVAKKTVKAAKLKKKAVTVSKAVVVSKAQGKVSYAKVAKGSSKQLTVNAKDGKVTVKKGTKAGTYKVKVKVTAKGNANHKPGSKTVTVVVTVK